jgi:phage tail protein X
MARTYRTKEGDTADWICWRAYGQITKGLVEKVLAQNAGLSSYGPVLPAGVKLTLPDIEQPAPSRRVRLWG